MRKIIVSSLLSAEIAAFAMLMLLFFLNTSRPYLLFIPIAGAIGGYFLIEPLTRKSQFNKNDRTAPIAVITSILLGIIIAAAVIGPATALGA